MSDNNQGQSFAEKYANTRRSSFTSQNLQQKSKTEEALENKQSALNQKSIDPQKKTLAELIYLVKGVDAGRNAWYYVLVDRIKVQLFLKALNDDIIHLENYGKILFSAYGDEPPEEITNKLKEEYGIQ